jgi:hypothetical protein
MFPTGSQYPVGMPTQDEVNNDKQFTGALGSPFTPPRLWMWDFGDQDGTLATSLSPRWDATDVTTAPDKNNTVGNGRESGLISGYLDGPTSTRYLGLPAAGGNKCFQWQNVGGSRACPVAPDELTFQSGAVGVVPERNWQGFPVPLTYYWQMANIPAESFFRKPLMYLSTGDHFWTNSKLASGTENQTWAGSGGSNQARFTALPMWFRGTAPGFQAKYTYPFKRLRDFEQGAVFFGYNPRTAPTQGDVSAQAEAKGIMTISIEPIECLLPGPQTKVGDATGVGPDLKQMSTYKRRENGNPGRGKSTMGSKIKVYYQDLFAFSDYYDGAGVVPGVHQMSDPILVAEAYCPRIDITWDYTEWANRGQLVPDNTPAPDPDCRYPKITMESQPFEWKRVLKDGDQVEVDLSVNPLGSGKFLDPKRLSDATDLFIKEFDGYACKFVVDDAYWSPNAAGSDQQWFSKNYNTRNYAANQGDREGTFLAVSGYIEVVEK